VSDYFETRVVLRLVYENTKRLVKRAVLYEDQNKEW
jgi:hypothetical protein